MLKKEQNPALFDAIAKQYQKDFYEGKGAFLSKEITDEMLSKITKLTIENTYSLQSVTSLEGIEQLVNLEELKIETQSIEQNFRDINEMKSFHGGSIPSNELDVLYKKYNNNQIEDFSPLYKCKKIKKLSLNGQRKIKTFNLKMFPKLENIEMISCENLKSINGFSDLDVFKPEYSDLSNNKRFQANFSDCYNLRRIFDLEKLTDKLIAPNADYDNYNYDIKLPTILYSYLTYQSLIGDIKRISEIDYTRDIFTWTENYEFPISKVEMKTVQMEDLRETVRQIIADICPDSGSDLDKISYAYRYLCDNIKYDYEGLRREKEISHGASHIRNSYNVLKKGKGVCVGISNAFNLMLAEMGYNTDICHCSQKGEHILEDRANISTHQISRLKIKGNDGEDKIYYFDPTWDLGKQSSQYFCLSKDEMAQTHQFCMSDYDVKNAPSLQNILRENGCLGTRNKKLQTHKINNDIDIMVQR